MSSPSNEETSPSEDPKLPLYLHIAELRKRLLISSGLVFVIFLLCWTFSGYVLGLFTYPVLQHVDNLQFDVLTDPFFTHLKASFYLALFLGFPLLLGQLWLFVSPALYKKEKQVAWPFLFLSYPLFVGGGAFFYFLVFPYAIEFLVGFDKNLLPSLRVGDYLSFSIRLLFVFGLVFELPLVCLLLGRMGFITRKQMSQFRRYAVIILFVVAAILTPPDLVTQALLALPLLVLYEISIWVVHFSQPREKKDKKKKRKEKEESKKEKEEGKEE